jgi:hypothetical protein
VIIGLLKVTSATVAELGRDRVPLQNASMGPVTVAEMVPLLGGVGFVEVLFLVGDF